MLKSIYKDCNKCDEKFTSAIGLGDLLEKPEGADLQTDKPIESYTIVCKNRTWGRKTQFTYETVQDTLAVQNLLADTVGSWGKALPRTKDRWYSNFFNYGAATSGNAIFNNSITGVIDDASGNKIYDNQPFFVASDGHKDKVGNGYTNFTETRALTHSNLQTTYITYTTTNARDEKGNNIELIPDTLLIPPALRFTAQVILNTTLLPGSMDNDTNVLAAIVNPVEWHNLTDTDGWFLGKAKHGLMATDRLDVMIDFWQDFNGSLILRRILKNGVNCWNILANKAKTISSLAWKVISLKVQRLMPDSYRLAGRVMATRVPCISMR